MKSTLFLVTVILLLINCFSLQSEASSTPANATITPLSLIQCGANQTGAAANCDWYVEPAVGAIINGSWAYFSIDLREIHAKSSWRLMYTIQVENGPVAVYIIDEGIVSDKNEANYILSKSIHNSGTDTVNFCGISSNTFYISVKAPEGTTPASFNMQMFVFRKDTGKCKFEPVLWLVKTWPVLIVIAVLILMVPIVVVFCTLGCCTRKNKTDARYFVLSSS